MLVCCLLRLLWVLKILASAEEAGRVSDFTPLCCIFPIISLKVEPYSKSSLSKRSPIYPCGHENSHLVLVVQRKIKLSAWFLSPDATRLYKSQRLLLVEIATRERLGAYQVKGTQ